MSFIHKTTHNKGEKKEQESEHQLRHRPQQQYTNTKQEKPEKKKEQFWLFTIRTTLQQQKSNSPDQPRDNVQGREKTKKKKKRIQLKQLSFHLGYNKRGWQRKQRMVLWCGQVEREQIVKGSRAKLKQEVLFKPWNHNSSKALPRLLMKRIKTLLQPIINVHSPREVVEVCFFVLSLCTKKRHSATRNTVPESRDGYHLPRSSDTYRD